MREIIKALRTQDLSDDAIKALGESKKFSLDTCKQRNISEEMWDHLWKRYNRNTSRARALVSRPLPPDKASAILKKEGRREVLEALLQHNLFDEENRAKLVDKFPYFETSVKKKLLDDGLFPPEEVPERIRRHFSGVQHIRWMAYHNELYTDREIVEQLKLASEHFYNRDAMAYLLSTRPSLVHTFLSQEFSELFRNRIKVLLLSGPMVNLLDKKSVDTIVSMLDKNSKSEMTMVESNPFLKPFVKPKGIRALFAGKYHLFYSIPDRVEQVDEVLSPANSHLWDISMKMVFESPVWTKEAFKREVLRENHEFLESSLLKEAAKKLGLTSQDFKKKTSRPKFKKVEANGSFAATVAGRDEKLALPSALYIIEEMKDSSKETWNILFSFLDSPDRTVAEVVRTAKSLAV